MKMAYLKSQSAPPPQKKKAEPVYYRFMTLTLAKSVTGIADKISDNPHHISTDNQI